jgi:hypothetical protein
VHVRKERARRGVEEDLTVEAGVPPLVLVLDERRVRPPHDLGGEQVGSVEADELGDVELGLEARVLAHTDLGAVDPQLQGAVGTTHVQHDAPVGPLARYVEGGAVATSRVLLGHVRREIVERHDHVRVDRPVEALHRPAARHGHVGPRAVVEVGRGESFGRGVGPVGEREPPGAVERPEPGAAPVDQRRPHRQPSDGRELGLRPPARHGRSFARTGTVR